jgi:hypothetical protein
MRRIATLVGVIGLMVPSSALAAGSSTCQAYNPQTCNVSGVTESTGSDAGTPSSTSESSGTLPFTGIDVVLLLAGGGTLLGAGFVVRRLSRRLD